MLKQNLPLLLLFLFVFGCSKSPYRTTNKVYKDQAKAFANMLKQYPLTDSAFGNIDFVGTTNFGMRKPNFVVIHHTAQNSCEQTLKTFTTKASQVSAHYVICKDGTVHHMLNDYLRAYHAGVSKWGNTVDLNSASIGIEIDNNGFEKFTDEQINSLLTLLGNLKKAYNIPTANFIGHSDIAPTRKVDPNIYFPWKMLAQKGFGLWPDEIINSKVDSNFNHLQALRIIGYDIKDTSAAIRAFKRHFMQDSTKKINEADKLTLQNLYKKYM
ncbi:N-acetylmuramoyl-L-alanine amidase [Parasediminibacterium paludis]|uniref:N-acetylmuramoyl-L-alanine amidase n=1 Tax=Parasediminibacterium paludis TaxID=908966 RepID=A0ABV8PVA2_9BACT